MGELLLEGFVHVLFEVRGFDVFNDGGLKRKTRGGVKMTMLSALSKVTGSSHTSVGFHYLTMRLYCVLVLPVRLKKPRGHKTESITSTFHPFIKAFFSQKIIILSTCCNMLWVPNGWVTLKGNMLSGCLGKDPCQTKRAFPVLCQISLNLSCSIGKKMTFAVSIVLSIGYNYIAEVWKHCYFVQ